MRNRNGEKNDGTTSREETETESLRRRAVVVGVSPAHAGLADGISSALAVLGVARGAGCAASAAAITTGGAKKRSQAKLTFPPGPQTSKPAPTVSRGEPLTMDVNAD